MASRARRAATADTAGFGSVRVLLVLALITGSVAYQALQASPAWASQVSVEPDGAAATCPAASAAYEVTVANESLDTADTYAVTAASSAGWRVELRDAAGTMTLAVDETGDGVWETVAPEADSNGDGVPDTGELAHQDGIGYRVVVVAPGGSEGAVDTTTFLAVSSSDDLHRDAAALVTTVRDCVPPSIAVSESATPGTFYEEGGTATFAVEVTNTSGEDLWLAGLSNSVFGDLLDPANSLVDPGTNTCPAQSIALVPGAILACSFDATLSDDGSGSHTNTVTATVVDGHLNEATRTDDASVSFSDRLPSVAVSKSASPAALAASGTVTFAVEVANTSGEDVTLTALSDSVFGNLLDAANPAVAGNTCAAADPTIAAGATLTCSFDADLEHGGTGHHVDTVTATVVDDEASTAGDSDAASVAFDTAALGIDVEHAVVPGTLPETGGTVTFTVEVANTSSAAVTLTSLSDTVFGNLLDAGNGAVSSSTCASTDPAIAAGATFSCSFEATLTDDGSGAHADTVTAAVQDAAGSTAAGSDGASVSFSGLLPAVSVTMIPWSGSVREPGGTVTFTVAVTNTSGEDVTLTGLVDSAFGNLLDAQNAVPGNNTCSAAGPAIAAGATLSCTFDGYVAGDFGGAAHLSTVTATVADDEDAEASDAAVAQIVFSDALPSVTVSKTPSVSSVPEPAGTVTFTVEVTDTSPEDVTLTALSDSVFGDLLDAANAAVENNTCAIVDPAIATGATWACTFDGVVEGEAGGDPHANTVSATVGDDDANTVTAAADATVFFDAVSIVVAKTPSASSVPEPGDDVTFTIEVDNTSAGALTLTALSDSVFGDLLDAANAAVEGNTCAIADPAIATGATFECSFDGYVEGDSGDDDHVNTVTATVEDARGAESVGTAEATVSFDEVTLLVTKTPSASSVPEPGDDVTFTIDIENTSAGAVTLTALSDSVFGDLMDGANAAVEDNTCSAASVVVAAGGTLSCSFDGYVEGAFGDDDHVNTVTATVEDAGGGESVGTAEATVSFDAVALSVTKTPSSASVGEPGDDVTFTVEVSNTSAGTLTLTALTDSVFGDLFSESNGEVESNTCATAPSRVIAAGGSFTCLFDGYVAGAFGDDDHVNTVTATAQDDTDAEFSASGDATIGFTDALPAVAVTKTPSATSVGGPGDDVTFTIEVSNTSGETVTLTALSDSVFGDLLDAANAAAENNTCVGATTSIGGDSPLTCSFDGYVEGVVGDADHANTVTATVSDDEGNTATGEGSATIAFASSTGVVAGHIFVDVDGDGVAGPADPPLSGVRLSVTDSAGAVVVAASNEFGDWEVIVPSGSTSVAVDVASVPGGYVLTTSNEEQTVVAVADEVTEAETIGYRPPPASVSGSLWLDLDGDPQDRAAGEPPLASVTMYLLDPGGSVLREGATDASGFFEFVGLAPGVYSIGVESTTLPDGLVIAGTGSRSIEVSATFTLAAGDSLTARNAAYKGTGIAGDQVWIDANGDGVADADEARLAGAQVDLTWGGFDGILGSDDDYPFAAAASDGAGLFRFDDLPPGTYRMAVQLSSVDVELTPTTPVAVEFTLGVGEVWLGGDFGFATDGLALPYTGLDTTRLGITALVLAAIGVAMLRSASVTKRRLQAASLWRNRLAGGPRRVREPNTWKDRGGFLD